MSGPEKPTGGPAESLDVTKSKLARLTLLVADPAQPDRMKVVAEARTELEAAKKRNDLDATAQRLIGDLEVLVQKYGGVSSKEFGQKFTEMSQQINDWSKQFKEAFSQITKFGSGTLKFLASFLGFKKDGWLYGQLRDAWNNPEAQKIFVQNWVTGKGLTINPETLWQQLNSLVTDVRKLRMERRDADAQNFDMVDLVNKQIDPFTTNGEAWTDKTLAEKTKTFMDDEKAKTETFKAEQAKKAATVAGAGVTGAGATGGTGAAANPNPTK